MSIDPDEGRHAATADPAEPRTRRERRMAARAAGRLDGRGPRTGELPLTDAALAARDAAGLTADLTATGRWRWWLREDVPRRPPVPAPRPAAEGTRVAGRHRGD